MLWPPSFVVVFCAVLLISFAILGIVVLPMLMSESPAIAPFALGYVPSYLFLADD